ncbi:hypothetical protein ABID65_006697 [Bradyrhizobium sp. S3.9.2]|uniref:hypothetical protein n=1 Tax=Bradyrhizobium sp. S3.9.2 TaxID=3156432 RepID=UPI0033935C3C
MTENAPVNADRRNNLLEAAQQELARFEQQEREFRKKDRKERAAELRLPLDKIDLN